MEAGFVAVHEREGSRVGKGLKGCRHAVDWRNSRGIGSVGIEHAGFDGPRAAHEPGGADHFLDEAELYGAGGLVSAGRGRSQSLANSAALPLMHRYETRLHMLYQRALHNLLLVRAAVPNEPSPISEQTN